MARLVLVTGTQYLPHVLTKTALVLSGLLVLAWGALMLLVEPASDPNAAWSTSI
jgi:hypothetical protein